MLDVFRSRRMSVLFVLGFSSGLPLLLSGQTLKAWMTVEGVPDSEIAAISSIGLAYTFKWLWAPLLDRFKLPFLGRRRGWVLVFQLALMAALAAIAFADPLSSPGALAVLALVIAFLSASQDVVLDAYSADLLEPHERTAGGAVYVLGYRVGVLVAGTLALFMADHVSWQVVYLTMAGLLVVGIVGTLLAEEPPAVARPATTLADAIVRPFVDFYRRLGWRGTALVIGFASLYRFGDYFAQAMVITFLKRGVGFSLSEIAAINKALAFAGFAVGGLFGGALVARFGLRKMLVVFGVLAAMTNLMYCWLALAGKNMPIFCAAVFIDHVATAMGTAAFIAVLMSTTSPAVSATQFALLTSLSSIGERVFGPLTDDVIAAVGWVGFYLVTIALAIPGLVLAWFIVKDEKSVDALSHRTSA